MNTGKPEASSLDSREKKVGPAPRSTGASPGALSGCSEGWALGSRHSFIGLNSETEVHPKSCLGRALSSLGDWKHLPDPRAGACRDGRAWAQVLTLT